MELNPSENYHLPVLLNPSIELLVTDPDGIYVDCTFGGGGHSAAILNKLGVNGLLIAIDQDSDAIDNNSLADSRLILLKSNFSDLASVLNKINIPMVTGILADLGVSSHQINSGSRGFSYRFEGQLDMRMNQDQYQDAKIILQTYSELELSHVFSKYGELPKSKRIAKAIVEYRKLKPIATTKDLVFAIQSYLPKHKEYSFLSQIYQALRIEVNQELQALESLLLQSLAVLIPEGRLAILSYHSLEDRMVKYYFATGNLAGEVFKDFYGNKLTPWQVVTKKPVIPDTEEIIHNPRSRSAKLRVASKR